jgi:mannitol/fructose-specific phosphotransferase system IIA component (Ntr-type)
MRLSDYTQPELIVSACQGSTREQVLDELAGVLCRVHPMLEREQVLTSLLNREKTGKTGMEKGVAVPHITIPGLEKPQLLIARLAERVDFATLDHSPVRIVFMLVSPPGEIATHIRLLARIARLCSDNTFLDAILAANAHDLYLVVTQEDARYV